MVCFRRFLVVLCLYRVIQDLTKFVKLIEEDPYIFTEKGDWNVGELWQDTGYTTTVHFLIRALRVSSDSGDNNSARIIDLATVWRSLSHPGLLQVYGLVYDGPKIALVHPMITKHDIIEYRKNSSLSPQSVFLLVKEIVAALAYLHENGIVVGNIRGINVRIDMNGHAMLSDIGIETMLSTRGRITSSCRWQPPEILIPEDDMATPIPTAAGDVYSTAMTILEIYTLKPPFAEVKLDSQFVFKLHNGTLKWSERPDDMAPSIWVALQDCWAPQPELRPTARELLRRLEEVDL